MNLYDLSSAGDQSGFWLPALCLVIVLAIIALNNLPPPDRGLYA